MNRSTIAFIAAGLVTAFTTIGANAQAAVPGSNYPSRSPMVSSECAFNAHMEPHLVARDINAIRRDEHVWVTPVCEDTLARNDYGTLFRDGNVETLRNVIARHPALMSALAARGYDHFDVVALRFGRDETVNLFVHQRDIR
ncbi:hypothetical protein ACFSX5_14380 [Devosia albogilva]|uniref:Uncharacterized protein n=1 Tax=Devosia albogilva TaxID=429726 RepID=A0ABW5QML6_9HYPH